jgi:transposase
MKKHNMRDYDNRQRLMLPPSIEDYLHEDDMAHVVDSVVEHIDMAPYLEALESCGSPSYSPVMMLKILVYAYNQGITSSRQIEEQLYKHVGFIYLAGMQKPDHKTISEFRRKHIKLLPQTFDEVVRVCHALGMVGLEHLSMDSTVIKANASASRTYDSESLQKLWRKRLEEDIRRDEEEDRKYGEDKIGNELPEGLRDPVERKRKIKEAVERIREAKKRLETSGKKKINLTDPDAQFQKDKGKKTLGYRAQIVVDGKEQVILTTKVTGDQSDTHQLIPMVDKVLEKVTDLKGAEAQGEQEGQRMVLSADAGYHSGPNLAKLEGEAYKDKIEAYIPDGRHQAKAAGKLKEGPFDKEKFVYDRDRDEFTCPAGKKLILVGIKMGANGQKVFLYRYRKCWRCEYFGECTKSPQGRTLQVCEFEPLTIKMRQKLSTEEGQAIYGKRKTLPEPAFGNLKGNRGFVAFRLRGEKKSDGEFALMAMVSNIKKIWKKLTWLGMSLSMALRAHSNVAFADSS